MSKLIGNLRVSVNEHVPAQSKVSDPPPVCLESSALHDAPAPKTLYVTVVKPLTDRVVGLSLLILALPIILPVALLVRASLGKGVLFVQWRVGQGGIPFPLYKFRTMLPDRRTGAASIPVDGVERRVCHKRADDPRHTGVGRFLRKTSLDELPQLWNIARGEMSLVGPRPELVTIVEERYAPWQHRRHTVKPGLTGLWQITARDDSPMYLRTETDLEYVDTISPATDLRILLLTIPAVLRGTGT